MRRHSDLHQSAAISAVLLVLLFALPLAVVVPFQTELFSDDPIAVESEREPFQPGDLDGEMVLKVLAGGRGGGDDPGRVSGGGGPGGDAGLL